MSNDDKNKAIHASSEKEDTHGHTALYHGTPNKFNKFAASRTPGGTAWFSDNKKAVEGNKVEASHATGQDWHVMERYLKPGVKLVDRNTSEGKRLADNNYHAQLKAMGYRGIKHEHDPERGHYHELFHPNEDTISKHQFEQLHKKPDTKENKTNGREDSLGRRK